MAKTIIPGWCAAARTLAITLLASLFVAACGGGGGGGGDSTPAPASLEGTWRVSLTLDGTTYTGGTVPASSVPSQQQVASLSTASMAQLFGSTAYQSYTVTINGSNLTITGPSTNLSVTVNSVSGTNYKGCGVSCGVGATVSYDVTVTLTATGTTPNGPASGTPQTGTVSVRYTRVT